LIGKIQPYLKGKDCEVFASDLRVFVQSKESYFYPDATIICGELEVSDEFKDTIKNPTVIFEILSPSTSDYDLGRKFFYYMQIESFKEYITIDTLTMQVRIGRKQENQAWLFEEYFTFKDSFLIKSIGLEIALHEVYDAVEV
jgi:Uma2 family endonuclease